MKPLRELVREAENAQLLKPLVDCLAQAYADAADFHQPDIGSDARTYGMQVYTFAWHRLREFGRVRVTEKEPFWFEFAGAMVASHRVGGSATADIEGLFPNDRTQWPVTVARQGTFSFATQVGINPNVLVLAHVGNPQEGLLSAYLCRPLVDESRYLVRWEDKALLWARTHGDGVVSLPLGLTAREDVPREEVKPIPQVALKRKHKGEGLAAP